MQINSPPAVIALLYLFSAFPGVCQPSSPSDCSSLLKISDFFETWSRSDTVIHFPLSQKRKKAVLGSDKLFGQERRFYSSAVTFSNQAMSEFGIGSQGTATFVCLMGPFSEEDVDKNANLFREEFRKCNVVHLWTESDPSVEGVYLYASYQKVDIALTLYKRPKKDDKTKYWLVLDMFRFTSL